MISKTQYDAEKREFIRRIEELERLVEMYQRREKEIITKLRGIILEIFT